VRQAAEALEETLEETEVLAAAAATASKAII
jgi:hypothetical protein